jgi:hypothetical protein
MVSALALWLNASIAAQNAAESIASFFVEIIFTFLENFMLHDVPAAHVPNVKSFL